MSAYAHYVFLATLPFCYWTVAPSVLTAVVYLTLHAEQKFVQYKEGLEAAKVADELSKLRSEMNVVKATLGFKGTL